MPAKKTRPPEDLFVMPAELLDALRRCRNVAKIIGRGPDGKIIAIPAYPDGVPPEELPPEPPKAA